MNASLQKNKPLRKCWDEYLQRTRRTQKEIAERAGVDGAALSRAIKSGIAPESVRERLRVAGVPIDLLPLPACPKTLMGIIEEQQQKIRAMSQKI